MSRRPLLPAVLALSLVPAAVSARDLLLEEVVVTAQKREQNAMDVPVTVDTFSNKDLENTGALDVEDIAAYIPGFDTGDGVTQNTIKVRGVENSNISSGQDPSVATFFDEVYLPAAAVTVAFSDLAQIEVLKGPQGTLFGRNAALGVVNMIPNQPNMEELEAFVSAKVGSGGIQRYEGMANVPLNSSMALRFNILANQQDSPMKNRAGPKTAGAPISKPDPREADNIAARVAFKWDVNERLSMQLAYDYDDVDNGAKGAFGLGPNSDFTNPADRKLGQDAMDPGETRDMYSVTGKLWYDISDSLAVKFITSYRPYETYNLQDEDGTSSEIYLDTNNLYDSDIFYNEVQFNLSTSFAEFVFGVNYSTEETHQVTTATASKELVAIAVQQTVGTNDPLTLAAIDQAVNASDDFTTESLTNTGDFENYGVYFDGEFVLTDWLSVLGGVRYSVDEKTFTWFTPENDYPVAQVGGANLIFPATDGVEEGNKSWSDVTGRLVANIQIAEGAMAFITYSTGYKSGGFDSLSIVTKDEPLDPEIVENIEFGVKGDFLDARLRTQLSIFYTTIDGRQEVVESLEPGSPAARPVIVNADEEIEGFEWTIDYLPWEELRIGAVFTLRENSRQREPYFDNEGDFRTNDTATSTAPKDYTITLDWQVPFGGAGDLFLHADYIFKDNIARDSEDHRELFNSYAGYAEDTKIINLRLTWVSESNYEIALWGTNLDHDDSYASSNGVPEGLISGITGDYHVRITNPSTWGMDFKWVF